MPRLSCAAGLLLICSPLLAGDFDPSKLPSAASSADFEKDVRPILQNSCASCHAGEKPKSKFSLETRELLLKGGKEDKAIVAGESAKSPLIFYVANVIDEMEMPPKGKGAPLTRE